MKKKLYAVGLAEVNPDFYPPFTCAAIHATREEAERVARLFIRRCVSDYLRCDPSDKDGLTKKVDELLVESESEFQEGKMLELKWVDDNKYAVLATVFEQEMEV